MFVRSRNCITLIKSCIRSCKHICFFLASKNLENKIYNYNQKQHIMLKAIRPDCWNQVSSVIFIRIKRLYVRIKYLGCNQKRGHY